MEDFTTSQPLVSIIMAVYEKDNEIFFKEAVESLLNQTWENLEIILIADGKIGPNLADIIDGLDDSRIYFIQLDKNRGPAHARNIGFQHAKGEYIAVMDSDDISSVNRIEFQVKELIERKLDVIGSQYTVVNEKGEFLSRKKLPCEYTDVLKMASYFNPINNPTALGKAEVFKSNPYNEKMRKGEDYHLWISLLISGHRVGNSNEVLLKFRGHNLLEKRKGLSWAKSDFVNRILSLKLVPFFKKPQVILFAFVVFFIRLMPASAIGLCYKIKNLTFDSIDKDMV